MKHLTKDSPEVGIGQFCRNCQERSDIMESGQIIRHPVACILKKAREGKGMTQQQVADEAKMNLQQYQKFENGERNLYTASFWPSMAVCRVLEITPDELMKAHNDFIRIKK